MVYSKVQVHIDDLINGDTVEHNGEAVTVSNNTLKHCSFMGRALLGDSYRLGYKPVTKLILRR